MNDTSILASSLTFLIVAEFFIAGLGGATGQISLLGDANYVNGTPTTGGTSTPSLTEKVLCLFTFAGAIGLLFTNCAKVIATSSIPVVSDIASFLQGTVEFLHGLWTFFQQFVQFQFSVLPSWLNLLIIVPPTSTVVFIGYRSVRNGGG